MATLENVPEVSLRRIAIRYGLLTSFTLMLYFLMMWEMDKVKITEFRFVNYVIIFIGMYSALNDLKSKDKNHRTDYLPGMGMLFMMTMVVCFTFGIFMVLTGWININFIPQISKALPHWGKLTSIMVGFEISAEIFLISCIMILTVLMLFKRNRVRNKIDFFKKRGRLSHNTP